MRNKQNVQGKKLSVKEMRNLKGGGVIDTGVADMRCLPLGSTCGGECIYPFPVCCPGTHCTGRPGRGNPIGSCVLDCEVAFDVAPLA
jgi:natural product precursor